MSLEASPIGGTMKAHSSKTPTRETKPINSKMDSRVELKTNHLTILSWSDGTTTSLPLICVAANQFCFGDDMENVELPPDITNRMKDGSVVPPTPKDPPDDTMQDALNVKFVLGQTIMCMTPLLQVV
ncbi:dTDP-4-dehydrorhamnose reductase [Sesbania bispinosa]|nr:dTDP-4-dehydrorhamnose reductase [Sesbania bispinosa]